MMEAVTDDFSVADETPEQLRRAWRDGVPVLIIPSRLRRRLRANLGALLRALAHHLGHAADRVEPVHDMQARSSPPGSAGAHSS
jgi:hypothetical protein